jgi:hypothetical protein
MTSFCGLVLELPQVDLQGHHEVTTDVTGIYWTALTAGMRRKREYNAAGRIKVSWCMVDFVH